MNEAFDAVMESYKRDRMLREGGLPGKAYRLYTVGGYYAKGVQGNGRNKVKFSSDADLMTYGAAQKLARELDLDDDCIEIGIDHP